MKKGNKSKAANLLQNEEVNLENSKEEREAELVIAKKEKTELADELIIANTEKAELVDELVIANEEKAEREAELVIANEEKAKREAELVIANKEKADRAAELVIANEEKEKRVAELVIANAEKTKRAAELVIANAEKAKRAAVLVIANFEKEKRADELIIADKELAYQNEEKVKRAAELVIADVNKTKREAELVIAKIEKAKRIAKSIIADKELSFQTEEKSKRAAELVIADAEKAKRASELVIANIKKAKRSAELVIANVEKAKRSAELVIANKELVYQKSEKSKRAAELIIANVEKAKRAAELVIANIEKSKRAAELVFMHKELVLAKEKEKLVVELTILNKEFNLQINERKLAEEELRKSYVFSETLLKTIPFGMHIVDETGTVLFQNDNFKEVFGESAIGKKCWKLYRDDKKQCSDCPLVKGITLGETQPYVSNGVLGNRIYEIIHTGMMYQGKKAMLEIFQDITERKQADENLQKNESYLKETQVIANLGTYTMAVKSGKWTSSEVLDKIFGIDSGYDKSIEGWASIIHPEWQKIMTDYFINEVFGNKTKFDKEYKIIRKNDKAERWVHGIGNLKIDENDQPIELIGTLQDITERKFAELGLIAAKEKTEENEEKFRNLFEHSPIGKSMTGIDGSMHVNKAFCDIVGYSEEELGEKNLVDITHPEDVLQSNEVIQSLINGEIEKASIEKRYIHKNGNTIWVDLTTYLQRDKEKKPQFFITTVIDITQHKESEEKLRQSSVHWNRTFDAIQDSVTLLDTNQNIIQSNQAFLDLIHKTESEVLNHPCFGFVHGTSCPIEDCPFVSMKKSKSRETIVLEINNMILEVTVDPIFDDTNSITGAVHIIKDITKNKQIELGMRGLATIIEHSLNEIYIFRQEDLKFTYVNSGALRNIGFSKEEMLTKSPVDIKLEVTPDSFLKIINPLLTHEQDIINFETIHHRKDGTTYPVDVYLQLGKFEGKEVFVAMITDVTERKISRV